MFGEFRGRKSGNGIDSLRVPSLAAVLLGVTLLLAVSGPFNTYGLGRFAERLVYWGGLVLTSFVLAEGLKTIIGRVSIPSAFWHELVSISLFVPLFTPILLVWTDLMFPSAVDTRPGAGRMMLYVTGICVAIEAARYGGHALWKLHLSRGPVSQKPRFAQRLPDDFDGEIFRLSGDGHYVNVSTSLGEFDVLIRLSDAVAEMDSVDGYWVHRSHWVVRAAVEDQGRERGRPVLILKNGDSVPVSAKYQPHLEEIGIL